MPHTPDKTTTIRETPWTSLYQAGAVAALVAAILFRRNIGAEISRFTGILAMLLSLALIIRAIWFVQRRHGGWVQITLSVLLLLFGGGFFPPLIGLVGGAAGTQINRPLGGQPRTLTRLAAKLWPYPLVLLITVLLAQFPVGYFFNDFLKSIMVGVLLFIVTCLPLSLYAGYARDAVQK